MVYEPGDLKTMQSGKEIDLNTTLPAMIDFRNALRQAKTGFIIGEEKEYTDNKKKLNQVRGLSLLISTQETLITLSRAQIEFRSLQKWKKKNKDVKEEEQDVFFEKNIPEEQMKYDYGRLMFWNNFLQGCRKNMIEAERTKIKDDDLIIIENVEGENIFRLTTNFWNMLEDLQESFSAIHLLMLINKVISSGVEQDEELSYKEQEQMFIERAMDG